MNIDEFKQQLLTKKDVLIQRILRIEENKKRGEGPLVPDSIEQALSLQNSEVIDKLDDIERDEVEKIDVALERIKDGSYGVCQVCGELIHEKRLRALPFATMCINCAEK